MNKSQIDLAERFEKFLKSVWPLPAIQNPLTVEQMRALNRIVWYCNLSGKPIPELQDYNSNKEIKFTYQEDDSISSIFYKKGYRNYRVYPNGKAFIDIHIVCELFDYYVTKWLSPSPDPADMKVLIENLCENDPFSVLKQKKMRYFGSGRSQGNWKSQYPVALDGETSKLTDSTQNIDMYICHTELCTGGVRQGNIIPRKYLQYLIPLFSRGDIVDTRGDRGSGLYILSKKNFRKIRTGRFYPIWSLKQLKKFGYRRLLGSLMWQPGIPDFEEIAFENRVLLDNNDHSDVPFTDSELYSDSSSSEDNEDISDTASTTLLATSSATPLATSFLSEKENGNYLIKYPFPNAKIANEVFNVFKIENNNEEKKEGIAVISDWDSLIFTKEGIYLGDLDGNQRLKIYTVQT